MTFTSRNLSVLAYAQGFTLWHYKAKDVPLQMLGKSGFFDLAGDMIVPGDMVMLSAMDGGTVAFAGQAKQGVNLTALS